MRKPNDFVLTLLLSREINAKEDDDFATKMTSVKM